MASAGDSSGDGRGRRTNLVGLAPEEKGADPAAETGEFVLHGSMWGEGEEEPFEQSAEDVLDAALDGAPLRSADDWAAEAAAAPYAAPPPPATAPPKQRSSTKPMLAGLVVAVALGVGVLAISQLGGLDYEAMAEQGRAAEAAGDLSNATRLYERALAEGAGDLDEDDTEDLRRRAAQLHARQGAFGDALPHARKLAEAEGASIDDKIFYARMLAENRQVDEAATAWAAIAAAPDVPAKLLLDGATRLVVWGRLDDARGIYQRVLGGEAEPLAQAGLVDLDVRRGDYAEAQRALDVALTRHPGHPALLTAGGRLRLAEGRVEDAEAAFSQALGQAPTDVEALLGLAEVHLKRRQRDQASRLIQTAVAQGDYRAYLADGIHQAEELLRLKRDQIETALAACLEARNRVGEHPLVLLCEAKANIAGGQTAKAGQLLDRARMVGPGVPEPMLARAVLDANEGDTASALGLVEEALTRFPGRYDLQLMAVRLLNVRERGPEAKAKLDGILARQPDHPAALIELADMAARDEKYRDAQKIYTELVARQPWNVDVRYGLADVALDAGQGAAARAQYEAILALDPTETDAMLKLASVYMVENKDEQAIGVLRRAFALGVTAEAVAANPAFAPLVESGELYDLAPR